MVIAHKIRVFEVQRRAGGKCLRICSRHHAHVLHPVLWHLHDLHVSEEVQDQPVLPHHCESQPATLSWFKPTGRLSKNRCPNVWTARHRQVFVLTFTQVRKLISDFAIILAILIFCGVDMLVGVDTPKLIVPTEFKVSPSLLCKCWCRIRNSSAFCFAVLIHKI